MFKSLQVSRCSGEKMQGLGHDVLFTTHTRWPIQNDTLSRRYERDIMGTTRIPKEIWERSPFRTQIRGGGTGSACLMKATPRHYRTCVLEQVHSLTAIRSAVAFPRAFFFQKHRSFSIRINLVLKPGAPY